MIRKRIREIAETRVRYGYRRIHIVLSGKAGPSVGHAFIAFITWKACR